MRKSMNNLIKRKHSKISKNFKHVKTPKRVNRERYNKLMLAHSLKKKQVHRSKRRMSRSKRRMSRSKRRMSRSKSLKSSKKSQVVQRKYSGVQPAIFDNYLKLDENVHRILGDSKTENSIRKDINELGRDLIDKPEPELLANEFLYLERLYNGMIDENNKVVDKNSNVPKKKIDEKGYYNILDDLYNEETPDDYDSFAIKTSPEYGAVKDILDQYDPSNKSDYSSTFQKKIVRESDNNRGFFSTDKPRGPKVRTSEKAKRAAVELAGKAADIVATSASSIASKVSTTVGNLSDLAGKAVDIANAGIASSVKAAGTFEEGVKTVGTAADVASSSLKAASKIGEAGANAIEKAGDAASAVINTGAKVLEVGTAGLNTVSKVGDLAIEGLNVASDVVDVGTEAVKGVGSAVKIAGSAVRIAGSGLEVAAAGAEKAASVVAKAATSAARSIRS